MQFVVTLAQARAGAIGLASERRCIPGSSAPAAATSSWTERVRHPHKIHIGDNVVIDDNCLLDAKGEQPGDTNASRVFVGRNTICPARTGDIELAEG
jgi:hypothetical protein